MNCSSFELGSVLLSLSCCSSGCGCLFFHDLRLAVFLEVGVSVGVDGVCGIVIIGAVTIDGSRGIVGGNTIGCAACDASPNTEG